VTEPSNPTVRVDVTGGRAEIVLNRPHRKNAIDQALARELLDALRLVQTDDEVQVVLLRGEGGVFCSGLDLDALRSGALDAGLEHGFAGLWRQVHSRMWELDKPLVGTLQAFAINGGASLALACDVLLASHDAFLQVGEVRFGMAAPMNLLWLRHKYGLATATRVALFGERLGGDQLVSLGIARESCPADQALERARAICDELLAMPRAGCQKILQGLRPAADNPFASGEET
jgi:enoyl-CoA hydratase/carnithine racemase